MTHVSRLLQSDGRREEIPGNDSVLGFLSKTLTEYYFYKTKTQMTSWYEETSETQTCLNHKLLFWASGEEDAGGYHIWRKSPLMLLICSTAKTTVYENKYKYGKIMLYPFYLLMVYNNEIPHGDHYITANINDLCCSPTSDFIRKDENDFIHLKIKYCMCGRVVLDLTWVRIL